MPVLTDTSQANTGASRWAAWAAQESAASTVTAVNVRRRVSTDQVKRQRSIDSATSGSIASSNALSQHGCPTPSLCSPISSTGASTSSGWLDSWPKPLPRHNRVPSQQNATHHRGSITSSATHEDHTPMRVSQDKKSPSASSSTSVRSFDSQADIDPRIQQWYVFAAQESARTSPLSDSSNEGSCDLLKPIEQTSHTAAPKPAHTNIPTLIKTPSAPRTDNPTLDKTPPTPGTDIPAFDPAPTTSHTDMPTFDQASPTSLTVKPTLHEPVICFCGEEAVKMTSVTFGVFYECHYTRYPGNQEQQPCHGRCAAPERHGRFVCSFHVHQDTWSLFQQQYLSGKPIDIHHPDLSQCSSFNLTVCIYFRKANKFHMRSPALPRCYCNERVIRRQLQGRSNVYYYFCRNMDKKDSTMRCTWILAAHKPCFPQRQWPIHTLKEDSDEVTAVPYQEPAVEANPALFLKDVYPQTTTPHSPAHQNRLLKSLMAVGPSPETTADADVQQPPPDATEPVHNPMESATDQTAHKDTATQEDNDFKYLQDDDDNLYTDLNDATDDNDWASHPLNTPEDSHPNSLPEPYRNVPKIFDTTLAECLIALNKERETMLADNNSMREQITILTQELEQIKETQRQYANQCLQIKKEQQYLFKKNRILSSNHTHIKAELEEEVTLRQNSQQRIESLETVLQDIVDDKKQLLDKISDSDTVEYTDGRCIQCETEKANFILAPCSHGWYCSECADRLEQCITCQTPKCGIQKMYLP